MTKVLWRIDEVAAAWAEAMTRACLLGGAAILLAWCITRVFPRLPAAARDWIWRLAYLKLLIALVWAAPIELPLLPASMPTRVPQVNLTSDKVTSGQSALATRVGDISKASPGPDLRTDRLPMTAFSLNAAIFAAWCVGAGLCSLAIARNWFATRALRRSAQPVADPELTKIAVDLWRRVGVAHGPLVMRCDAAVCPQLVGTLRPAIILPAMLPAVGITRADVRMILAHEFAHWRRRDLWWNWLPALAHVLFYFHPAVWLAHREWRLAQEIACDEAAIELARVRTADYGRTLLNVVQHCRIATAPSFFSVGVSHSFQTLSRRIAAMQSTAPFSQPVRRAIATMLFSGAAVGLIPWRLTAQEAELRAPGKASETLVAEVGAELASDPAAAAEAPAAGSDTTTQLSQTKPPVEQLAGQLFVEGALRRTGAHEESKVTHGLVISIDPNTGKWKTITEGGHAVRVSPDGSTLAFEKSAGKSRVGMGRDDETWICDARTGADARRVAAVGGRPIWSPNGRELVGSQGQTNEEDKKESPAKPVWDVVTWKFGRAGGEKTKLPIPSTDFVEDWSPDGQWFVTSSDRHAPYGRGYQIYLMRPDGTEQRRLTEGRGLNVYVRFSPDGKRILFLHQEKGKNSVRAIELATGKETTLFEDDGLTRVEFACWSPDGKRLAILREDWVLDEQGKRHRGNNAKPRLAILDLGKKDLREIALPDTEVEWFGHVDWK